MENIYIQIRKLAKSIKAQNLFVAAKELQGIRLFRNRLDFSRLQGIYLSYLYMYDTINKDIVVDRISEKIWDSEIYEDAYLLWKRKSDKKSEKKDKTTKDLKLIPGKTIKFPVGVK